MSFQQAYCMLCFIFCLIDTLCIRVEINTIRNSETFTCLYILFPFGVIIGFLIGTKTTANDCKINSVFLHLLPVNSSIMIADINTFLAGCLDLAAICIAVIPIYLFPCFIIAVQSWCIPIINDQHTILISPAIFNVLSFFFLFFRCIRLFIHLSGQCNRIFRILCDFFRWFFRRFLLSWLLLSWLFFRRLLFLSWLFFRRLLFLSWFFL